MSFMQNIKKGLFGEDDGYDEYEDFWWTCP